MPESSSPDRLHPSIWLERLSEIPMALLLRAQWEGGMSYHRSVEVPGTVDDLLALLPEGADVRLDQQDRWGRTVVAELPGLLAALDARKQMTSIDVVGSTLASVEQLVDGLAARVRAATVAPEGAVRMRFWSYRDGISDQSSRRVAAPSWAESERNYARRTADALRPLMTATDTAGHAGRLILWHGAPGTGKTTAVRALSRAWAGWCRTHYVMDP